LVEHPEERLAGEAPLLTNLAAGQLAPACGGDDGGLGDVKEADRLIGRAGQFTRRDQVGQGR
jgi:hypothetical protein